MKINVNIIISRGKLISTDQRTITLKVHHYREP